MVPGLLCSHGSGDRIKCKQLNHSVQHRNTMKQYKINIYIYTLIKTSVYIHGFQQLYSSRSSGRTNDIADGFYTMCRGPFPSLTDTVWWPCQTNHTAYLPQRAFELKIFHFSQLSDEYPSPPARARCSYRQGGIGVNLPWLWLIAGFGRTPKFRWMV